MELLNSTPESHPDKVPLTSAVLAVKEINVNINEYKRRKDLGKKGAITVCFFLRITSRKLDQVGSSVMGPGGEMVMDLREMGQGGQVSLWTVGHKAGLTEQQAVRQWDGTCFCRRCVGGLDHDDGTFFPSSPSMPPLPPSSLGQSANRCPFVPHRMS